MKLSYFDLLSPEPFLVPYVGFIIPPTPRRIRKELNSYDLYATCLSLYSLTVESYCEINQIDESAIPEDTTILDIMVVDERYRLALEKSLNFFIQEKVVFNEELHCFFVFGNEDSEEPIGVVNNETWKDLKSVIKQMNYLQEDKDEAMDISKAKSAKAKSILEKLKKGRDQQAAKKKTKQDPNLDFGNIISAVSNKHNTLSPITIQDATVYMIWDAFYRTNADSIYYINSMSVAAWGNKDNSFDLSSWYENYQNK